MILFFQSSSGNIIAAGTSAFTYLIRPYLRYFKVVLTNTDAIDQSYLRLETILKTTLDNDTINDTIIIWLK
jgi:hypothetical protein